ncbi:MAG: acyl-CoA dehydrogenase [Deltaproteobacteria bacterium]|nr:acyl-CoA dehydrogenase [Deltaproteobacteria bacterium]
MKGSSTQFRVDRRDIRFVQKELLAMGDLVKLKAFSEFSPDDFDMAVEEGLTFSEEVFAPLNQPGDAEGCRMENGRVKTPKGFQAAWKKNGEGGWLAMASGQDHGGGGFPYTVALAVLESQWGANPSLFITSMLTEGAAGLISEFGTEDQKKRFVENMLSGRWGGTMCLSEPQAGSAVGDALTKARKAPDGDHYLIEGNKQWISGGDHDLTPNVIHLVLARMEGDPAGTKGLSLFIVPRFRLDAAGNPAEDNGIATVRLEHKLGIRASPTCALEFGAKGPCHGYLLGKPREGMKMMFKMMNEARLMVGLQGLASSAAAYGYALAYANERKQGVPIEKSLQEGAVSDLIVYHPDVRQALMTIKATAEGTRALLYYAGYCYDLSRYGDAAQQARYQNLIDLLTPMAKNAGADLGYEAVRLAMQVLAGVGYTEEFPVAQLLRDTKIASIYEGTTGIQALDLVGRKLVMKGDALYGVLREEMAGLTPGQAKTPSLAKAIERWRQGADALEKTVNRVRGAFGEGMFRQGAAQATDLANFMALTVMGWLLLRSALVAQERLLEKSAGWPDEAKAREMARNNDEVRFYFNKIKTAEHLVFQMLPKAQATADIIAQGQYPALDAVLE